MEKLHADVRVQRLTSRFFSFCSISEGDRSSPEETARPLKFESRFESGNLRKAIQVFVVNLGATDEVDIKKLAVLPMCDALAFQLKTIHDSTMPKTP